MNTLPSCLIVFIALLGAGHIARAQDQARPDSPETLLQRAEDAVEEGEALAETNLPAARQRFTVAAAAYRELIELQAEPTPALLRNAGTTCLLSGDPGRAVLYFKRALRLRPADARALDGLAAARGWVRTETTPTASKRVESALRRGASGIPRGAIVWLGLLGWMGGWGIATVRAARGEPVWSPVLIPCILFTAFAAGLVGFDRAHSLAPPEAVVMTETWPYRGPNKSVYDRVFEQPLQPGVEGRVLESREGWLRLRLRNGSEAWIAEIDAEGV